MKASELSAELARMAADMGDPEVLGYAASEDLGTARVRYDVVGGVEVLIIHSGDIVEDEE